MFHFMTHAFFKALLFLAAGVVILAQHHEHDMFRMGGLRTRLPLTFWTFLIGAASLSALPLVTAGFYSKDLILSKTLSSGFGNFWLWGSGVAGALITALYAFRMVFITFFGEAKSEITHRPCNAMTIPLVILAFFSIFGGFTDLSDFLHTVFLEAGSVSSGHGSGLLFQAAPIVASLGGILIAYLVFLKKPGKAEQAGEKTGMEALQRFWFSGWGFDRLYQTLIVGPFLRIAARNKADIVDSWYSGFATFNRRLHGLLSLTQTGNIRWYAMALALGGLVFIGIVIIFR
jgi:NADH-quinone oxidoreductase subunit L